MNHLPNSQSEFTNSHQIPTSISGAAAIVLLYFLQSRRAGVIFYPADRFLSS